MLIEGIIGAGIGVLVGLLVRPFLDAYLAARSIAESHVRELEEVRR